MVQNYRMKLNQMTDEELADEWVYETGVSKNEVMADIEEERGAYIDELIYKFKQDMQSRGEYP